MKNKDRCGYNSKNSKYPHIVSGSTGTTIWIATHLQTKLISAGIHFYKILDLGIVFPLAHPVTSATLEVAAVKFVRHRLISLFLESRILELHGLSGVQQRQRWRLHNKWLHLIVYLHRPFQDNHHKELELGIYRHKWLEMTYLYSAPNILSAFIIL